MKSNLQILADLATRAFWERAMGKRRKHRQDGTVYTKPSLEERKTRNRRVEAARKEARKLNRKPKRRHR